MSVGSIRRSLRAASKAALARGGAAHLALATSRSLGVVLAYHNIVPDDHPVVGDAPLHLRLSDFRRQLDRLVDTHRVLSLTALARSRWSDDGRPNAVITFDDAYRGSVVLGLRELAARGLPATVFVAPGLLEDRALWWDTLAHGLTHHPGGTRDKALGELGGDEERIARWASDFGLERRPMSNWMRTASVAELDEAARLPGVTYGSHSVTHRNLARLGEQELSFELEESMRWLRQQTRWRVIRWLSYPYGRFTRATERAARATGYDGALSIGTGRLPADWVRPWALPRVSVPADIGDDGFLLRVAGLVNR